MSWAEFVNKKNEERFDRVLVALDTARDRIEVQAALPKSLLNAWTQPGDLGISRHRFDDERACLACLYVPEGELPSEDELIANALQIPARRLEVRNMLGRQSLLSEDFLMSIATEKKIDFQDLQPFVGKSLGELYRAICGGALISLNLASPERRDHVPMVFQSAFAGVLMASEVVKLSIASIHCTKSVTTRIDILNPQPGFIHFSPSKRPDGNCFCQDPDYLAAYHRKYS
jgi:hypothetical protein